ncbi:uncharacterized protein KY384_008191 [Bacidia gigantensis]|uniref:uncharacterized protein n=1 Tax=Bacidia gigantensis TaxID=2732470 RepID=UPI001D04A140|nr:uncharacterized protein KY384_008191 [Bacidia gigantensis]KAG8526762.1 hypothetical protein KY384_008191 [Bacidia gigantensis]
MIKTEDDLQEYRLSRLEKEIHTISADVERQSPVVPGGEILPLAQVDEAGILSPYSDTQGELATESLAEEPLILFGGEYPPLHERVEAPLTEHLIVKFKALMRAVPHALAVISSILPDGSSPRALLVSSFNSVTVSPIPYISFNIRKTSSTLAAIKSSRRFIVTVIGDPRTANVFADLVPGGKMLRQKMLEADGRLKPESGGVICMECRYTRHRQIEVGDHVVIVGEVLDVQPERGRDLKDTALVYWHGEHTPVDMNHSRFMADSAKERASTESRVRKVVYPEAKELPRIRSVVLDFHDNPDDFWEE